VLIRLLLNTYPGWLVSWSVGWLLLSLLYNYNIDVAVMHSSSLAGLQPVHQEKSPAESRGFSSDSFMRKNITLHMRRTFHTTIHSRPHKLRYKIYLRDLYNPGWILVWSSGYCKLAPPFIELWPGFRFSNVMLWFYNTIINQSLLNGCSYIMKICSRLY